MKILKRMGIITCTTLVLFTNVSSFNSVSAVSESTIRLHEETEKLVSSVINYYLEMNSEGLPQFLRELNEDQLKRIKRLFLLPRITNDKNEISLSVPLKGVDLLTDAVDSGDLKFVKLIDKYFDINDFINETSSCGTGTPLWEAVVLADEDEEAAKDIVDYLLSRGADPYNDYGKGYIPYLFEGDKPYSKHRRVCLKEVFENHGYVI